MDETQLPKETIANSDFSYELPDTSPDPDFDKNAKDAIAAIAGEFYGDKAEDEGDEEQVEGEDEGDVLAPTEGAATKKPADEDDPKLERGVQRLVTRELAAKEREAAADAKERSVKAQMAELAGLQGLKSSKEQSAQMATDPVGVMKAWGHDPEVIIRLALAQQLQATGQPVPEKLQKFVEKAETTREINTLRAQVAQQAQAREAQDYFNTVSNGAREYVNKSVGDSTPTVALAAKANPDRVHREIMEEIVRDSNLRAASDPTGDPLSYDAAAKLVEARWVELKKLLLGEAQVQNGKSAAQNAMKPKSTTPPASKPAARPLAPWMKGSEKTLEDQGIEEAMREYNRAESVRKQRQG